MDPSNILFSLPTLCESTPAVEPARSLTNCRSLHEDDWRQIEFVPAVNHRHVEKELEALTTFKQQHRRGSGWTEVYVRKEHPMPLAAVELEFAKMPPLPVSPLSLGSGPPWGGLIKGGFALSDSGNWFLYGQRTASGKIVQLALAQNAAPLSLAMAQLLSRMASDYRLLLVDWYGACVVDTSSPESVMAWSTRYSNP